MGKTGFAVQAPWPESKEVDPILSRQAALIRKSLRFFRNTMGKAKKGWTTVSIVINEKYPDWKIQVLEWIQSQYNEGAFPSTFMKDLKTWASQTMDKKMMKNAMQFASFRMKEVQEIGITAMDIQLPFDQKQTFVDSLDYIKSQLDVSELDVIGLPDDSAGVPERVSDRVEPGTPQLWIR